MFLKCNISIETSVAGVFTDLALSGQAQHYGISPTKTAERDPQGSPEVPYVMVTSPGNANIVQGRIVKVQYKTGTTYALMDAASYTDIFVGEIALLNDMIDYTKGEVTFKVRNSLAKITQDFFGEDTHYGDVAILTDYDGATANYDIPSTINDVYAATVDGNEISSNNWGYDYLLKMWNSYKSYSDVSTIALYGSIDKQLKDVVDALLSDYDYNAVTDSATPLKNLFFPSTLSVFRALRQLGWCYNYRLFAAMDGDISFNPVKLNTDAETLTIVDNGGTVPSVKKFQEFKSNTQAEAFGALMKVKSYSRYANVLDDFNDNGSGNNFGGNWLIETNSTLNTVSPTAGNFSASYERGNYGAKLYANIVTGYARLYCTLNNAGTTDDLSSYTGITIKYRCTSPLYVYVDNAYYKLPAVGSQTEASILFTSFTGTITDAAVTNISFMMKDTGTHEFFIDYVKFYPTGATTETFYESETQLTATSGTNSGGKISIELPWIQDLDFLQGVSDSINSFYSGGIDQYEVEVICPTQLAEIGDIVKLTSAEHFITDEPFEVIAWDWKVTATNFVVTYLLQTAYTLADLTKRRQDDIDSGSDYFTTTAAEGTGTETIVTFNRPAEELSGQSRFNYEIKPPSMDIYSVTGTGNEIEITFNTKVVAYDKDFFKAQRFSEFGIVSVTGDTNSIVISFDRPVSLLDKTFFKAFEISIFGYSITSATGTSIVIEFDRPLGAVDKSFFSVQKFI